MYSGEAKVPKEIVNKVLRGGEILKIKGLYREENTSDKNPKIPPSSSAASSGTPPPSRPSSSNATASSSEANKPPKKLVDTPASSPVTIQDVPTVSSKQISTQDKALPKTKYVVLNQAKESQRTYSGSQGPKVLNFTLMQKKAEESRKRVQEPTTPVKQKGKAKADGDVDVKTETSPTKDSLTSYLMIKDEPIDWSEADMEIVDSNDVFDDVPVKTENTDDSEESNEKMFSALTCELCTETFSIPGEWVRHVQTHTDMMPAKRRRRDSPEVSVTLIILISK